MKPWTRRQPRRKTAPTLAEALARYLIEVSATKKSHTSEQSIARIWRATRLAIRPVDRIRSSDLTELRDEWLKDRAPATVVRRMAFLSHVYTVIRKDWVSTSWPILSSWCDVRLWMTLETGVCSTALPCADCRRTTVRGKNWNGSSAPPARPNYPRS